MSRRTVSPALLVVLAALALPTSHAAAAGFDLRWDACAADGGVANHDFACDGNVGQHTMVVSFKLDQSITDVYVVEAILDLIVAGSAPVPDWWDFNGCRNAAMFPEPTIPPGAAACVEWSPGNAFAGLTSYDNTGTIAPADQASHMRMHVTCVVGGEPLADLAANQEYFLCNLNIDNYSTVDEGAGNCAGCSIPVCIVLNSLRFTSITPSITDLTVATSAGSNFATWQQGTGANCSAVPVRRSTWARVKGLYR